MIKYKHPTPISGYIQFAQKGDKIGEYRRVNPEDYVIDPNTGNRRNKYTGQEVTFIPEGFDEEGVVVTGKRIYSMFSPEQRAQEASEQNVRDREIASQYFDQAPTIPNLAKGVYHWYRGRRSENPEDYKYVKGIVDLPVSIGRGVKGIQAVSEYTPKLMPKVGKMGPDLNVQGLKKIEGLPVPTGKTRVLKEVVGERPLVQGASAVPRTFEEGVRKGYSIGIRKATNKASQPQDIVSKEVAKEYANRRVSHVLREQEKENNLNNLRNYERVKRAFDLGKRRGENLAKSQNVNSVKSPTNAANQPSAAESSTNAAKSSTNAVSKSNEKLTKFQKFKQKVKSKPVKTGLKAAGILGIADIARVSVLNQDPTRDAKLIPIEVFNWVSNGLMSKEGRQYKLVGDQIKSLKDEQRLDSLKRVRDTMLKNGSSQQTSSSQNAPNDTIGLNTMQVPQGNSDGVSLVIPDGVDIY